MICIKVKPQIAVIGLKGLPAFGGAAAVGENIIKQLKDKYDFTVYSISSHTRLKTGEYNGIKQIVFHKIPLRKFNTLYYYFLSSIHAIFNNYDIVHLHHYDAAFIIKILKFKYKVIITTHGFSVSNKWRLYSFFFKIQKKYLKYADLISSVSKIDCDIIKKELNLNSTYIPNGINLPEVIEKKGNNYLLFSARRIIDVKGLDILLKALIILDYKGVIKIIGEYDKNSVYFKKISRLATNFKCDFLGLIKDRNILINVINNAKLFIFPSRHESMSMMLLEVISLKTPIICSNIKANTDILREDEVLFFNNNSVSDLANKIKYSFNNYHIMKEMSKNAFRRISKDYLWKNIAKEYKYMYEKVLNHE